MVDSYFAKYQIIVYGYEKETGISYSTLLEYDDAQQAMDEFIELESDDKYDVALYRRMSHSYVD